MNSDKHGSKDVFNLLISLWTSYTYILRRGIAGSYGFVSNYINCLRIPLLLQFAGCYFGLLGNSHSAWSGTVPCYGVDLVLMMADPGIFLCPC